MTVAALRRLGGPGFVWKIVAGIFTLIALNYMFFFVETYPLHPLETIQSALNLCGLVALWCLGFRVRFLTRWFWRVTFLLNLGVFVACMLFVPTLGYEQYSPAFLWALILVPCIPYYIGLFIYTYKAEYIWGPDATQHPPKPSREIPTIYKVLLLSAVAGITYALVIHITPKLAAKEEARQQALMSKQYNQMQAATLIDVSSLLRWQLPDANRLSMSRQFGTRRQQEQLWLRYRGDSTLIPEAKKSIASSGWGTNLNQVVELIPEAVRRQWNPPLNDIWVLSEQVGTTPRTLKLWILDRTDGGVYFYKGPMRTPATSP